MTPDTSWYDEHISDSTFTLNDAEDLFGFAQLVNNGNSFGSKTVTLGGNINLNNEEWTPIGTNQYSFSGTFDGAGNTISGLNITQLSSLTSDRYYGLFGFFVGTVQNLNLEGSINLPNEETHPSYIGGLVGYNTGGTIQNCTSAVSISATSNAVISAGGLAGYNKGSGEKVSESSATGSVSTISTYTGTTPCGTGGLIGYLDGVTISKNYASGIVSAKNTVSGDVYAGGIVGYKAGGDVKNSYTTSKITAESSSGKAYAGGIAGYQGSGTTSNSFTTGEVVAKSTSSVNSYSGGIAGGNFADIKDCYATGKVTATSTSGTAGGIVGYNNFNGNNNVISNCYALNSEISGTNSNGIAGTSLQTLDTESNYVLNGLSTSTPSDGTSVASSSVWNQVFGLFTDANGWKINEGNNNFKLPVLKNLPAPANADASHLSVPCITFYANGGTEGTMQPQFVEGSSVTLNANKFKKEGYSFTGWATSENGGVAYADNETIQDVNADITLFAQWKINQYTLKFEDYYNQQTVYCETKLDYGATVPTTFEGLPPTKTGYTFYGWHIAIPSTMPANNVTIMALWNITQYNVTFNTMDGSDIPILKVNYSETIGERAPANPTKHGYNFEGWYNESDCTNKWIMIGNGAGVVTDNITLYANWTAWKHFITFHNYAGVEQVKELTYGSDMNLPKNTFFTNEDENKHFGGWAITEGGAVFYEDEADVSSLFTANNGETDLYAVWLDTPITYRNVTFMIDSTKEYQKIQIQDGKALGLSDKPTEPTRPGYDFLGWYKESTLDTALSFDNDYVVDADTKFYAKWNPIFYYVQFNNNTGTGTMVNQDFKYGVTEALSANTFTAPSGKEFAGWNTKADGSGDSYAAGYDKSDITVINEDTVILYAQWKDIGGGNDGSDSGSDSDSDYDDYEPSTPSTPSKPSTPTTPDVPDTPDTPKVTDETKEISVSEENTVTLPTGDKVVVVALENTEAVQRVAVPEAVAQANPGASVKVTEGETAPALPESVAADNVHIVVGVSVVDKEGNPVKITESGYFILDADVPAGKKLVVGHYKNDIWVDCLVENLGNGQHKVHYNGLSPFAAVIIEEHEESPFTTEEKPTEEPTETPAPILGLVLGGLAAAVVLRRK